MRYTIGIELDTKYKKLSDIYNEAGNLLKQKLMETYKDYLENDYIKVKLSRYTTGYNRVVLLYETWEERHPE